MKKIYLLILINLSFGLNAQVGVNTLYPSGVFHVDGLGNNTSISPTIAHQADDVFVNSSGQLGIGTTAPTFSIDVVGSSANAFRSTIYGSAPIYDFRRSDGTATTPTNVGNGAMLANLRFFGNRTGFLQAASLKVETDGTPTATSMPGRIIFVTTPAATVSPVERMRINAAGNVGIGVTDPTERLHVGGNIRFNGTLRPNNLTGNLGQALLSQGGANPPIWGVNLNGLTSISRWIYPPTNINSNTSYTITANIPGVTSSSGVMVNLYGDWVVSPASNITINHVEARTDQVRFIVINNSMTNYLDMDFVITVIR